MSGLLIGASFGQEDPGKQKVGQVMVSVYYASDQDPESACKSAKEVDPDIQTRLRKEPQLKFTYYRLLGQDTKPLYRSYENWAEPLKPSDTVMVRFEAQAEPTKDKATLDLELWLARKKTIKTDAHLEGNKPLYVLGPKWRGGRLIIAVALAN